MHNKLTLKYRSIITGVVTILIGIHLLWDHFHGGVPIHYILQSPDLPGISNWLGGIILPILTWFLLFRVQTRKASTTNSHTNNNLNSVVYRILGALIFGLILSFLFSIDPDLPGNMMIGAILLSFFIPLYLSEYLLGFILGTAYTFGVVLPLVGGIILILISLFIYKVLRAGILYLISKIK